MAVFSDEALVLGRTTYGESSLVVHLLCRRAGRVHLLAKGAYRRTSRFYCVLDFFDTLELEWSESRRSDLGLLRQGLVLTRRNRLTTDLEAYRSGLCSLELAALAARAGQDESQLFDVLQACLDGLEEGNVPADLTLVVFELAFLQNLGLAPALETCAVCGGPAPAVRGRRAAFSAEAGGRLCRACAEEAQALGRRVGTLPVEVLELAAQLARSDPRSPAPTVPEPAVRDRVRDLVERFLNVHLETQPASQRAFLAAPNRNSPQST